MKNNSCKQAAAVGFILTLIICSFLLLSGIALHNTATAMFGTDWSVLEITATDTAPELEIAFFDTEYRIHLTGINQAIAGIEQSYALIPRKLRLIQTFLASLEEGLAFFF